MSTYLLGTIEGILGARWAVSDLKVRVPLYTEH